MITSLNINNFKSIKSLQIDCNKVNLLIGQPNSGKSNILESLSLLSHINYGNIKDFVRFEDLSNLFYNENTENPIKISFEDKELTIFFTRCENEEWFEGSIVNKIYKNQIRIKSSVSLNDKNYDEKVFKYDYKGEYFVNNKDNNSKFAIAKKNYFNEVSQFKSYSFISKEKFPKISSNYLQPPHGDNLLTLLKNNRKLLEIANDLFNSFGYNILFDSKEKNIKVVKKYEGMFVAFPYFLVSDTLQRMVFYYIAIYSNKNSTLIFEEPEAHAFPLHTKLLGESIGLDENNNQYFITTHNPYLFQSIIEKTPKKDLAIFIVYSKDHQTKIKHLNITDVVDLLKFRDDIFFNLDQFLDNDV